MLKILRATPAARACSKNFEKVRSAEIFLKRNHLRFFPKVFLQNFLKSYSIEHLLAAASVLREPARLWILLQRYLWRFIFTEHLQSRYLTRSLPRQICCACFMLPQIRFKFLAVRHGNFMALHLLCQILFCILDTIFQWLP